MRQFYKPSNVEIGSRIRVARESARMTREAFAERVDISAQFLADKEMTARQLSVLLNRVPRTLLPLVIDSIRDQVKLIEAAQIIEKSDRKDD